MWMGLYSTVSISIHPPREGWDVGCPILMEFGLVFQSTHPVRGGTLPAAMDRDDFIISIHPPREGWDTDTRIFTF